MSNDIPAETCGSHAATGITPVQQSDAQNKTKPDLGMHFDSVQVIFDEEDTGDELDLEIEELSECRDWDDKDLQKTMYELAVKEGDDPSDETWLPLELMKMKKWKTGQL
jgi:hypothetical protein